MSTTMASTTVESASTVEASTTMRPAAYEAVATRITTSGIVAAASIAVRISFMSVAPASAGVSEARTSVEAAAIISAIPEPRRVTPVIPRARADKYAVYEVVRTVEAVRRTGIRIIVIVSVRADRRTCRVGRAHRNSNRANTHPNSDLRLRIR